MKKIALITFFTSLFFNGYGQSTEEVAIKQLLEKESKTWRSGDVKEHAACWYIQPYSKIIVSLADGTALDIPPTAMLNPPTNSMGKGGTSVNSNYKMSANGNTAWVSHNEESTSIDGKKTYSYEIRMLEKINNQWKLVGQSIHIYNPK